MGYFNLLHQKSFWKHLTRCIFFSLGILGSFIFWAWQSCKEIFVHGHRRRTCLQTPACTPYNSFSVFQVYWFRCTVFNFSSFQKTHLTFLSTFCWCTGCAPKNSITKRSLPYIVPAGFSRIMLRVLVKQPSESYQLLILKGKRITTVSSEFRLLYNEYNEKGCFQSIYE